MIEKAKCGICVKYECWGRAWLNSWLATCLSAKKVLISEIMIKYLASSSAHHFVDNFCTWACGLSILRPDKYDLILNIRLVLGRFTPCIHMTSYELLSWGRWNVNWSRPDREPFVDPHQTLWVVVPCIWHVLMGIGSGLSSNQTPKRSLHHWGKRYPLVLYIERKTLLKMW